MKDILNVWGGGQLLAFSGLDGLTDFHHGLVARTCKDGTCGVQIMHPAQATLQFAEHPPRQCHLAGDSFTIHIGTGVVRGAFVDAHHLLLEGPCQVGLLPPLLTAKQADGKTLVGVTSHFRESLLGSDLTNLTDTRQAWLNTRRIPAELSASRKRVLTKSMSVMKTQVCTPEGLFRHVWTTPDRWPHRQCWLWDSAFHAIGWRHIDTVIAHEAVEAVLDLQAPDGRIPHSGSPDKTHPSYTQPPVLALAAWMVHQTTPSIPWLRKVYPGLCRYVQWDLQNRDTDGYGLVEWAIEPNKGCRSGESGADNSSRFDSATQLDAPDFNAWLALECERLARMADQIAAATPDSSEAARMNDEALRWRTQHRSLCDKINERLWSESRGLYMDADAQTGAHTDVLSFAGFQPLVCGAPSAQQAARLVEHLHNPKTFGTELRVPTIAPRSSPAYGKDMWRGPVWVNINWMIAIGLVRYGYLAEADALRNQTLNVIEQQYEKHGCIFEYLDDEDKIDAPQLLRKGTNDPSRWVHQVIHDYGWSATLYVDWVLGGLARLDP
jgi:hypothetical protein